MPARSRLSARGGQHLLFVPGRRSPALAGAPVRSSLRGGRGWSCHLGTPLLRPSFCAGFSRAGSRREGDCDDLGISHPKMGFKRICSEPLKKEKRKKKEKKVATPFKLASCFLRTPPRGLQPAWHRLASPRRAPERRGTVPSPPRAPSLCGAPLPRGAALSSRRLWSPPHVPRPATT